MCDGHMGHPTKRPCDLLLTHDHTGQCAECGCSGGLRGGRVAKGPPKDESIFIRIRLLKETLSLNDEDLGAEVSRPRPSEGQPSRAHSLKYFITITITYYDLKLNS